MPTTADALLRIMRQLPLASFSLPRVLGVDDWAYCKGHRYGTILVDLERHRPLDLLPDSTAGMLSDWLKTHPGIEVVARDRSTEYARGITDGAPDAVQVADRWHLLKNLREIVQRLLRSEYDGLQALPEVSGAPERLPRGEAAFEDQRRRRNEPRPVGANVWPGMKKCSSFEEKAAPSRALLGSLEGAEGAFAGTTGPNRSPSVRSALPQPAALPSARELSWLLVREPEALNETERFALQQICQASWVERVYALAQQFAAMIRERLPSVLDGWIAACQDAARRESGLKCLEDFAAGLPARLSSGASRSGDQLEQWANRRADQSIEIAETPDAWASRI